MENAKQQRFRILEKIIHPQCKILDAGCGNHSAQGFKASFPLCEYFGVDRVRDYNNDDIDREIMDGFYEIDLTSLKFDDIPNEQFDLVCLSHIIEHLANGDAVIKGLIHKLKPGGVLYIEYPSPRSVRFPRSKSVTLNFYDDETHCRLYSEYELCNLLHNSNCRIIKVGTIRNKIRIPLLPIAAIVASVKRGFSFIGVWDILGFSYYIVAKKNHRGCQ